ncbi:hypothetical protein GPECTOR_6g600 [Gonium pectorale]|uniref:DNA repair protein RecN n=1 Tax=Gonium pectorale TaxID=33097 RepID=A0A150GV98_GONPE|nr:hypothetical protein GPECTOR_6g600 [Gonium pectorale]|eukprot:KXZ53683.1 hypothetical protein GPECTOR_6g600 [Gonium pectorale]
MRGAGTAPLAASAAPRAGAFGPGNSHSAPVDAAAPRSRRSPSPSRPPPLALPPPAAAGPGSTGSTAGATASRPGGGGPTAPSFPSSSSVTAAPPSQPPASGVPSLSFSHDGFLKQQRASSAAASQALQAQQGLTAGGDGGSSERTRLERLHVRDFALVSEQTVELGPGITVITGESGSGKSVLVEAFSQLLGAAAPQECVRAPAEVAVIEGTFVLGEEQRAAVAQLLAACGLPARALPLPAGEGGSGNGSGAAPRLTVRREISVAPGGGLRSRVSLNGSASSLRVLRELGALLVDTNGQHSATSLREPDTQLELLDRIAGTSPLADAYGAALASLRSLEGRLDELDELDDEEERGRMQRLVDAVAKLRVEPGEERELRSMLKRMEARRSAVEQCGLVRMALCGEGGAGGVTDALRTIEAQLNAILATEEANRAAAAKAKGKDASAAAAGGAEGGAAGAEDVAPGAAGGFDGAAAAGDEEDDEAAEAAGGARMMEEALERVAAAKDLLASAEGMVRSYARRYTFSQADHDATAERLARLERLMKQASAAGFGPGGGGGRGGGRITCTEELLAAAEECSAKLAAYYEMEGQREGWEAELDELAATLRGLALQLTVRRRAAAAALRSSVEACLRELAMGGSRFDVRIGWAEERLAPGAGPDAGEGLYIGEEEAEEAGVADLGGGTYVMGPRGLDQVEFLLAAGPAEPLRPLAAVASGGESARLMLALKAAPGQAAAAAAAAGGGVDTAAPSYSAGSGGGANVPIMILDELDSGIGSRLGSAVGSILARMAAPGSGAVSQILCVTHLPQVACYAAQHLKVQKELTPEPAPGPQPHGQPLQPGPPPGGRVTTTFRPLVGVQERCEEVAAMLGLDTSVAAEMLRTAQAQVAAMYPPGSVSQELLAPPAPPSSGLAGTAAAARASAVQRSGDAAAAATAADVVVASPFNIVVAPSITPNAVLAPVGLPPVAAAAGEGGSDAEEEEAELRAALMAGVEAAAMEHLARMQAQAAAAAEAAAAAAALVATSDAAGGGAATAAGVAEGVAEGAAGAAGDEGLAADELYEAAAAAAAVAAAVEQPGSDGEDAGRFQATAGAQLAGASGVAVRPSGPYTGVAASSGDDSDPAAAAAAARREDPGRPSAESSYDPYEAEEPPQQHDVPYDAPYTSASQAYDAMNEGHTVPVGGSGGRFVVVPRGHEREYDNMFHTITSFSREDYAGEAMKSCEWTLWQALRDTGLA